jgi:hypothetical protein
MRSTATDMGTQMIVMCPGKVHFCSIEGEGNFDSFKRKLSKFVNFVDD